MNIPQPLMDLLNKVEPGQRVMAFAVPLRVFRVICVDETYNSFRVEQLVMTTKSAFNPRGSWRTLSMHGGQVPFQAYPQALAASHKAQNDLRNKLLKGQLESQQAASRIIRP
jgi:hypothetical protein